MNGIITLAAVLVYKASKKDRSVTEAMTNDDIDLVSHTQYIAIQRIKNLQDRRLWTRWGKFLKAENRSGMSTFTQYYRTYTSDSRTA